MQIGPARSSLFIRVLPGHVARLVAPAGDEQTSPADGTAHRMILDDGELKPGNDLTGRKNEADLHVEDRPSFPRVESRKSGEVSNTAITS
jgi:hypothetical protein